MIDDTYVGPTLHRVARLCDSAHGGQTLLSAVTAELVADRLPMDAWLMDVGVYPQAGVPHPERVVQVCHPELARTAAPRQQTLHASVDWSHALLSEPERTLFRRDCSSHRAPCKPISPTPTPSSASHAQLVQ